MSVSQYSLADGSVRWLYVADLPAGPSAKRKQAKRRGFPTETAALKAEKELLAQFGDADLNADGTIAAELNGWLAERELDLAITSLSNYRNSIIKYVIPHIGTRQMYSLDKRVLHDLYKHLLARGATKGGGPLAAETVRTVHRTLMKAFKDLGVEIPGVRAPRAADKEEDYGRKGSRWFEALLAGCLPLVQPTSGASMLTHHAHSRSPALRSAGVCSVAKGARLITAVEIRYDGACQADADGGDRRRLSGTPDSLASSPLPSTKAYVCRTPLVWPVDRMLTLPRSVDRPNERED